MKSKWVYRAKKDKFTELAKELNIHPAILKIMADRGVEGKDAVMEYLNASLDDVSSGEELTDMNKAVAIMYDSIKAGKKIRVMGDYDVDGATSTYILYTGITRLGGNCDAFIPHRIQDGYGLHESAIRQAYEDGIEVIITCDNGIAAANEIKLAKELGMTVVVTDHHEIPYEIRYRSVHESDVNTSDEMVHEVPYERMYEVEAKDPQSGAEGVSYKHYIIPPADAVVDPKRPEDTGCFREICGAVVAWKFTGCLFRKAGREDEFKNSDFLEFASIGTVCDVMELQHDNRAIVKAGLKACQETKNIGLRALLEVLGLDGKALTSYDYGFKIGPCINAEGRLDSAKNAFDLFCETDKEKAIERATAMRDLNTERQNLTKEGMEKAFKIVDETMMDDKVLVVYIPGMHESIAGIVAGKVRERYNKPTFVLTDSKDFLKGSGRSIEQFSMYDELVKCKDLLLGFGGHPLAAGLSLKKENLEAFRNLINANSTLTEADFIPKVVIDVIMPVDFLTQDFIRQLEILEPFGKGNERPVFAQKHVKGLSASIIGQNKNVLKVVLDSKSCKSAVCFHDVEEKLEMLSGEKLYDFSMLYYPALNEWNGYVNIQANISDIC